MTGTRAKRLFAAGAIAVCIAANGTATSANYVSPDPIRRHQAETAISMELKDGEALKYIRVYDYAKANGKIRAARGNRMIRKLRRL